MILVSLEAYHFIGYGLHSRIIIPYLGTVGFSYDHDSEEEEMLKHTMHMNQFCYISISLLVLAGCSTVNNFLNGDQNNHLTIYFPRINHSDASLSEAINAEPLSELSPRETVDEASVEPLSVDPIVFNQDTPESTIASYWEMVNAGNYKSAWDYLSPGFQGKHHDDDYDDYFDGYQDMQLCSVKAKEIKPVHIGDISAVISANVNYQTGPGCTKSKHEFDHYLVYDQESEVWLVDDVISRPEEISDRDIAEIRTIQEQAARDEIDDEEAESKMLEAAAEIGIEGFTWIVRNVPIYDPDSESWMSFDNYARRLTGDPDAQIDPDSRFAKDPVGMTVDLFFRAPDPDTMMDWFGFDFYDE